MSDNTKKMLITFTLVVAGVVVANKFVMPMLSKKSATPAPKA
jgi:hypothetical protein